MTATATLNHSAGGNFFQRAYQADQAPYRANFPQNPAWQSSVEAQLSTLQELPVGWDGYGSVPVKLEIANFAINILKQNMQSNSPAPALVPVSGGGLQIEWHESGMNIELFIIKPFQSELFVEYIAKQEIIEEDLQADFSLLGTVIREL